MLNVSKGNMYPFVTHTWNTVKGKCPHGCTYCYMKQFGEQPPLHFDEKELKTNLGTGNFIFVGSSCDMFAADVEYEWVKKTLERCCVHDNQYLFQSKNPGAWLEWLDIQKMLPYDAILGTTLESNIEYPQYYYNAPPIFLRKIAMRHLREIGWRTMVTIEPIMDFNLISFIEMLRNIMPEWVNIGADSQGHDLREPPAGKIKELIAELERFTEVKIKSNLKRLLKEG